MTTIIEKNGFTNAVLGWQSWVEVVKPENASPEQLEVLEMSHPQAKTSDYYLTLVHQPEVLRQRSEAYNTIMYAPKGLPRSYRELGALTVSRINGCVYCSSVHAQRYEQLAKSNLAVEQVFDDPDTAGTTDKEKAVVKFSGKITRNPDQLNAEDIMALENVGLTANEIMDLINATAIFAWANRLMMNLGEAVFE